MDERVVQFRVGVVMIATMIIIAILILMFGEAPTLARRQYTVYIKLPSAPGVEVDTPVRKSGITIGRVEEVDFSEDGQVIVTASIDSDRKLRRNEEVRVTTTLLGDASLEFTPVDDPERARQFIDDGDMVTGRVPTDPIELLTRLEDNIEKTVDSVGSAGQQVATLAERVNRLLEGVDQEQFEAVLDRSNIALEGIARTTDALDRVIGDPEVQDRLRRGITDLPDVLAQARSAMEGIEAAVASARSNLENLKGFTEPLGEEGPGLVDKVNSSLNNLDAVLEEILTFAEDLNRSDGTLNQLTKNPELYDNLNRAVRNIEVISRQLKPIVNDVRIFSDKIARDPGRLGVSGVLRRRSGIK